MAQSTLDPESREPRLRKSQDPLEQIPTAGQEGIDSLKSKHTTPGTVKPSDNQAYDEDAHPAVAKRNAETEKQGSFGTNGATSDSDLEKREASVRKENILTDEDKGLIPYKKQADKEEQSFRQRFRKRRPLIIGGTGVAAIVIAAFALFASGPAKLLHFAKILDAAHMATNREFGNDRSARALIYAMLGTSNRSRLGLLGNVAADKWEARMARDTGLKPLFENSYPNRLIGYAIVDQTKADNLVKQFESQGIDVNGNSSGMVDSKGRAPPNGEVISLRGTDRKVRKNSLKLVGQSISATRASTYVHFRLETKRAGINLHPWRNKVGERREANQQARRDAHNEEYDQQMREGVQDPGVRLAAEQSDPDGDGVTSSDPNDEAAANGVNDLAREAAEADHETLQKIKSGIRTAKGPAVVIGALCAVRGFAGAAEEAQHQQNLVAMRVAGYVQAAASQAQTGIDTTLETAGFTAERLTDPETGQDYSNARSVQHETGRPLTGPDVPPEGKPGREKPELFTIVQGIPVLGSACGALDSVLGLPVIRDVAGAINSGIEFAINQALRPTGYNIDEILSSAVAFIAGRGMDPLAVGPAFGNVANYGTRLLANDSIIALGGRVLSAPEVAQINAEQAEYERLDYQQKSFSQRYLDPYEPKSLTGKFVGKMPSSIAQLGTLMSNTPAELFSTLSSAPWLGGKAYAAGTEPYDYGFPEFGYSVAEKNDPRFENPDENALYIEEELADGRTRLEVLNEEYEECFSMKVNPETLAIETGEALDFRTIPDKCDDANEDLLRYRYYLIDSVSLRSLLCYDGDEESCAMLGFGDAQIDPDAVADPSAPLTTLSGQELSANQSKWIKYIKDEVLSLLPGASNSDKALVAAQATWWALKEGVLDLENPHIHSICGNDNRKIAVTETCPAGQAWQVGIAGIQPRNFTIAQVRSVLNGRTEAEVLNDVAELVGAAEGSAGYNAIVNSTGILRISLLVRDPGIGLALVARDVKRECIDNYEDWCKVTYIPGRDFSSSRQLIDRSISELEQYFKGSGEGGGRIAAVAEAEYDKNGNRPLETCGENCGPEVQKYTGGPSGPSAPWCAWFVSWVYREAGYEFTGSPAGADGNIPAVVNLVTWFKQNGVHFTQSSTEYKPQPGDVVMYGGDDHTGVVVKVNGDTIETVEGNTSGDGSYNANGETVGRKSYNYKTYSSRSIEFGRLKSF